MMSKSSSDKKFMLLAEAAATNSDDPHYPKRQEAAVGCVIVVNGEVIIEAANRLPPQLRVVELFKHKELSTKYFFVEHAERTAIFEALNSGHILKGGTLYCTRFPCSDCARAILYAGLQRVVVSSGFSGEGHWQDSQRAALEMLRKAGVTVRYL